MDWKLFATTFGAIFVAELADKTQLVNIAMSSKSGKPCVVWGASLLAYLIVTAISVCLGTVAAKHIKPELIRYAGACVFIAVGILILLKRL